MNTSSSGCSSCLPCLAKSALLVSAAFLSTPASATTTVAPNIAASAEGTATFAFFGTSARTYQVQFAASQLTDLSVGSEISGLSFRLNGGVAAAPNANSSVSDFEITLAEAANAITSFSATAASNMTDPVLVRDGAYSVVTGTYPGGSTPNNWGPTFDFTTPYSYQGGDLVIMFSHSGFSVWSGAFDAVPSDANSGYVARWGNSAQQATLSNTANSMVIQLHLAAIPEPGNSALAVALGSVAFAASRRRRRA